MDKSVFPGMQGGPLMHVIAAKAVAFNEALQPGSRSTRRRLSPTPSGWPPGWRRRACALVSGGTDNHLMLVDVTPLGLTGKQAEHALDEVGITVNKNAIPFDKQPPG